MTLCHGTPAGPKEPLSYRTAPTAEEEVMHITSAIEHRILMSGLGPVLNIVSSAGM